MGLELPSVQLTGEVAPNGTWRSEADVPRHRSASLPDAIFAQALLYDPSRPEEARLSDAITLEMRR